MRRAVGSTPGGVGRIEQTSWWYRDGAHTLGQYYYYSPESLRRMYEHAGIYVAEVHEEWCYAVVVGRRMGESLVADLEDALRRAIGSEAGTTQRQGAVERVRDLSVQLQAHLSTLLPALESASTPQETIGVAQRVRRLWRGL